MLRLAFSAAAWRWLTLECSYGTDSGFPSCTGLPFVSCYLCKHGNVRHYTRSCPK